ncbi:MULTISPECIES: peroxide stress protein YaaA [Helcococcus]|uniref:UPF0246 protein ABGF40_00215 n=1 Tax=Helcococcus bovis TaxID=3153252 RepID=A0ABW9F535_9FIRM
MKIIFSPTKDMNLDNPINTDWILTEETHKIINELQKLSDEELKKKLKINDNILETVKGYISSFSKNITYPALFMYNGLSYKAMNPSSFNDEQLKYLNENLLILSALYGPISPNTLIKPYRLDFLSKIKIDNKTLKSFWKPLYNLEIPNRETILNLASNEFSDLFDKSKYNWIDFEFYENKNGKLKTHSTTSKKGRGWMVSYLTKNNIKYPEELKKIKDEFSYSEELSEENRFVFIKE